MAPLPSRVQCGLCPGHIRCRGCNGSEHLRSGDLLRLRLHPLQLGLSLFVDCLCVLDLSLTGRPLPRTAAGGQESERDKRE